MFSSRFALFAFVLRSAFGFRVSYPGPVVCSFPLLVAVAFRGCQGLLRSRSLLAVEVDRQRLCRTFIARLPCELSQSGGVFLPVVGCGGVPRLSRLFLCAPVKLL